MYLKLKALAGDVPVEILVRPTPVINAGDSHDVILAVGDSASGTLKAHSASWWRATVARDGVASALADNADRCQAKETPEVILVAQGLTIAAMTALTELGGQ